MEDKTELDDAFWRVAGFAFFGALLFSIPTALFFWFFRSFKPISILAAALLGALFGTYVGIVEVREEQKKRKEALRKERQKAREKAAHLANELAHISKQVEGACEESVRAFESLPVNLSEARKRLPEARKHFKDAAYSPFWHAIEQAYIALGDYNHNLEMIGELSQQYATKVHAYRDMGGSDALPVFPVDLDAASATEAARKVSALFEEIVYQAQRDPVFAQIWEQRRTTAAVITGFASLEMAIDRMTGTLSSSISSLSGELQSLSSKVSGVSAEIQHASSRAETIAHSQLAEQKELNYRMGKAVFYLKEEHRRVAGLL